MKIYTRTGDGGETGILGGRVAKDDPRVEAYGTVDELNSFIGLALAGLAGERYADLRQDLQRLQHELFDCGADLAQSKPPESGWTVTAEMVGRLEAWIDRYEAETPALRRFILPGGSGPAAALHVCRTVCRRAERAVVTLATAKPTNPEVQRYLNRLSDFFFMVARAANAREGVPDVEYDRGGEVFR